MLDEERKSMLKPLVRSILMNNGRRGSRTIFSIPHHRRSSTTGWKGGALRQSSICGAELGKILLLDPT